MSIFGDKHVREFMRNKPVRRGAIYCSPWCGYRCTWDAYQKAQRDAKALAERLGPTFEPYVWENLGWHYCARTKDGRLKVHPSIYRNEVKSYIAFISFEATEGGKWTGDGKTPEAAVRAARRRTAQELGEVIVMLEAFP